MMFILALVPGLPFVPFAALGGAMVTVGIVLPRRLAAATAAAAEDAAQAAETATAEAKDSVKEFLRTAEIEIVLGKQLAALLASSRARRSSPTGSPRCGASSPGSTASWSPRSRSPDSMDVPAEAYQIKIHGTVVVSQELAAGGMPHHHGRRAAARTCPAPRRASPPSA